MGNGIFDELIKWWKESYKVQDLTGDSEALFQALVKLQVMTNNEKLLQYNLVEDWRQSSEEYFSTIGTIDIDTGALIRRLGLAAYAVITPPPIPIIERINEWKERVNVLNSHGTKVPRWFLVWKGTIFLEYPPFSIINYLNDPKISDDELYDFSLLLNQVFLGLARTGIDPLGLKGDLRTDGLQIYYCGLGFDMGAVTPSEYEQHVEKKIRAYENEILKNCSKRFVIQYKKALNL